MRGLGWVNLWCIGCYDNSSVGKLSWYGRIVVQWEIFFYISFWNRFQNRILIGERWKYCEVWSYFVLNEIIWKKRK